MKAAIGLSILAGVLWLIMFSPWTAGRVEFWPVMACSAGLLAGAALLIDRKKLSSVYSFRLMYLPVGIISAAILYLVFFAGKFVSTSILPFAESQISGIYGNRQQGSLVMIGLLLFFLIGPAEEVFWRGFVQRRMAERFGPWYGYALSVAVYGLVHIWSFNFMLIAAAMVCGVFWGFLFKKYGSVWPGLISHAVWDVVIFVILPVQ